MENNSPALSPSPRAANARTDQMAPWVYWPQLAVVVGRQVVADLAQLLVDDVEVVHEPLGGRRDHAAVLERPGQEAV
jgi:hypothetical protein